ncbi:probable inactive serine/threonine-protein kinase scy2 [Vigna unguiculata]|uniref:probable inactive serine/threonine-protein kinase scy2 n=1 Tax=Vigna unguiculata TaxID=3917 RepID=UPI0010164BE1|nr:probable inactive serine/threonine-protein kinase scy2 [Vigna unguiculata]
MQAYERKLSRIFSYYCLLYCIYLLILTGEERKIETQIPLPLCSMAYGSNGKRGTTNSDNSTQHDNNRGNNHHIVNISTPSVTTTTISLPNNNPSPTPNHFPQFSGTAQSFNNTENGSQDFSRAKIKSPVTGNSFNNIGSGSQSFRDAEIRCSKESSKQSRSIFSIKQNRAPQGGTLHSFNNNGKGSQCFDGFKLN